MVVDTNVIINLLFSDQKYHKEAVEIWKKSKSIKVPFISLVELAYFLTREKKLDLVWLILLDKKAEIVGNNEGDLIFAISLKPKRYDELNDYIILSTALRLKEELITFDEELNTLYKRFSK